jgi:membrane-associated phospholipid phosphatase
VEDLDRRWFRDVNDFARHTSYLHEVGRLGAVWLPLLVVLACVGAAWARGRFRPDAPTAVASAVWSLAAGAIAWAVAHPLAAAVDRTRPYRTLPGVEVLVHRASTASLPDVATAGLAAVAAGLWFSDGRSGTGASLAVVGAALAQVYVGLAYPGDVAAGIALGATAAGLLRPLGLVIFSWLTTKVERSPLHLLVAAHRA